MTNQFFSFAWLTENNHRNIFSIVLTSHVANIFETSIQSLMNNLQNC
jgi:hypothetical protein